MPAWRWRGSARAPTRRWRRTPRPRTPRATRRRRRTPRATGRPWRPTAPVMAGVPVPVAAPAGVPELTRAPLREGAGMRLSLGGDTHPRQTQSSGSGADRCSQARNSLHGGNSSASSSIETNRRQRFFLAISCQCGFFGETCAFWRRLPGRLVRVRRLTWGASHVCGSHPHRSVDGWDYRCQPGPPGPGWSWSHPGPPGWSWSQPGPRSHPGPRSQAPGPPCQSWQRPQSQLSPQPGSQNSPGHHCGKGPG
jgi:hypothetical protein